MLGDQDLGNMKRLGNYGADKNEEPWGLGNTCNVGTRSLGARDHGKEKPRYLRIRERQIRKQERGTSGGRT